MRFFVSQKTLSNSFHLISLGNLPRAKCFTTSDSPEKNVQCKLPFKFDGVLRKECITDTDPNGRYWCSTKVDENLEHIRRHWGYCDQFCPPLISTQTIQGMEIIGETLTVRPPS